MTRNSWTASLGMGGRVRRKRGGDRQGCGEAGGLRRARAAPLPDHRSNPDGMTPERVDSLARNSWTASLRMGG